MGLRVEPEDRKRQLGFVGPYEVVAQLVQHPLVEIVHRIDTETTPLLVIPVDRGCIAAVGQPLEHVPCQRALEWAGERPRRPGNDGILNLLPSGEREHGLQNHRRGQEERVAMRRSLDHQVSALGESCGNLLGIAHRGTAIEGPADE
jgi:hypothetical protein